MEKIDCTNRVKREEVLHRIKEEKDNIHANFINIKRPYSKLHVNLVDQ
jgi:hypothetical protein